MHYEDSVLLVYYSVLHVWQIFGHSAVALRSLSALCAIAAIPFVAAVANRLFDRTHAIVASLLLALNPAYLYYATEARPYGAVALFAALAMYFFVRVAYGREMRFIPWYGVALFGAIVLHALAVLLAAAQAVSLVIVRPPRHIATALAWCYAAAAVALAAVVLLARRNGTAQFAWIPALREPGVPVRFTRAYGRGAQRSAVSGFVPNRIRPRFAVAGQRAASIRKTPRMGDVYARLRRASDAASRRTSIRAHRVRTEFQGYRRDTFRPTFVERGAPRHPRLLFVVLQKKRAI